MAEYEEKSRQEVESLTFPGDVEENTDNDDHHNNNSQNNSNDEASVGGRGWCNFRNKQSEKD